MQIDNVASQSYSVTDFQLLEAQVYRVKIRCDKGYVPSFYAGQYLEVLLPSGEACAFSIACAPKAQQKELELHIQRQPHSETSAKIFQCLKQGKLQVRMAKGLCHLQTIPDKSVVFIAAGTGFAQMKSMIEHCFNQNHPKEMHLYWGARIPSDFYLPSLPVQWSTMNIVYHPVVSEAVTEDNWNGRHGLLYEAILSDKDRLIDSEIYISGSPTMVYATLDTMVSEGFDRNNIHSDVFEYAPRD